LIGKLTPDNFLSTDSAIKSSSWLLAEGSPADQRAIMGRCQCLSGNKPNSSIETTAGKSAMTSSSLESIGGGNVFGAGSGADAGLRAMIH